MYSCSRVARVSRWRSSSVFGLAATAAAQGVSVSGRLYHSVSLKADRRCHGRRSKAPTLETKSGPDGSYSIPNVPCWPAPSAGDCQGLRAGAIRAQRRLRRPLTLDVAVDPELHYSEVVSVGPDARNQFDSYQPTTVLAGQDLAKQLRGDARRDARNAAWSRRAVVRPGPVASGHPRPRWRSRADPRRRPAGRRPVESVGRPRRRGQPHRRLEDRGRARSGDAALWLECDRRPRQRDFGHDPDDAGQWRAWRDDGRLRNRGRRRRRRGRRAVWATTSGPCTPRAAAADRATSTRRTARSRTASPAAGSARSASRGRASTATSAAATATTTRSTVLPVRRRRTNSADPAPADVRRCAPGRTTSMARSRRFASCLATGSTNTTSSRARRSARSSRTTPPISTSRPSTAQWGRLTGTIGGSFLARAFTRHRR